MRGDLTEDFRLVRNGMGISDLKRRAAIDRIEQEFRRLMELHSCEPGMELHSCEPATDEEIDRSFDAYR